MSRSPSPAPPSWPSNASAFAPPALPNLLTALSSRGPQRRRICSCFFRHFLHPPDCHPDGAPRRGICSRFSANLSSPTVIRQSAATRDLQLFFRHSLHPLDRHPDRAKRRGIRSCFFIVPDGRTFHARPQFGFSIPAIKFGNTTRVPFLINLPCAPSIALFAMSGIRPIPLRAFYRGTTQSTIEAPDLLIFQYRGSSRCPSRSHRISTELRCRTATCPSRNFPIGGEPSATKTI